MKAGAFFGSRGILRGSRCADDKGGKRALLQEIEMKILVAIAESQIAHLKLKVMVVRYGIASMDLH